MPKNRSPINLSAVATRLADQADLWSPLIKFDPVSRYYARLAAEATFEAWLLTWVPGQGTDWHDHGGSAGAFVVLSGTLTEEHAVVGPNGSAAGRAGGSGVDHRDAALVRRESTSTG